MSTLGIQSNYHRYYTMGTPYNGEWETRGYFIAVSLGDSSQSNSQKWFLCRVTKWQPLESDNETNKTHPVLILCSDSDLCDVIVKLHRLSVLLGSPSTHLLHLLLISLSFKYSELTFVFKISIIYLFINFLTLVYKIN